MNNKNEAAISCPDFDNLSAWYDHELKSELLDRHIDQCQNCQKLINDFKIIDHLLIDHCSLDHATVDRIKNQCRNHIDQPKLIPFLQSPVIIKIAASLVITGIVVFSVILGVSNKPSRSIFSQHTSNTPHDTPQAQAVSSDSMTASAEDKPQSSLQTNNSEDQPSQAPTTVAAKSNPMPQSVVSENPSQITPTHASVKEKRKILSPSIEHKKALNNSGELSISDLNLVDYNASKHSLKVQQPISDGNNTTPQTQSLNDVIHHVWITDDPTNPLKSLRELYPQQQNVIDNLIGQNLARYRLHVRITDSDLQNLVNKLDAMGCTLVSPDAPQPYPKDSRPLKLQDRIVQYDVDFVRK